MLSTKPILATRSVSLIGSLVLLWKQTKITFLEKCHFWDNSNRNADNYNTSEAKMKLETYSKSSLHRLYLCILWQTLNFYLFMSKTALEDIVSLSITVGIMEEYMERPRGVKMINTADGHRLCTSHRRKGLYG